MIDHGVTAGPIRARIARAPHDVSGRVAGPQPLEQFHQLLPLSRLDHIVGIEPEGEIACGACQRLIARRGEAIDPDEIKDFRSERPGNFHGPVGAAGVDDDDLVEYAPYRLQAMRQVIFLVFNNHGQADLGAVPGQNRDYRRITMVPFSRFSGMWNLRF
jgi:hypothetical protein